MKKNEKSNLQKTGNFGTKYCTDGGMPTKQ